MKVFGAYGEAEVIDAVFWRTPGAFGVLLPLYYRDVWIVVRLRLQAHAYRRRHRCSCGSGIFVKAAPTFHGYNCCAVCTLSRPNVVTYSAMALLAENDTRKKAA